MNTYFTEWQTRAADLFDKVYRPLVEFPEAACLLKASAVLLSAPEGSRPILCAGSTHWVRGSGSENGVDYLDYWSYKFIAEEAMRHVFFGNFPEMHCWVYDLATDTVLDLSGPDQPKQALRLRNVDWGADFLSIPEFIGDKENYEPEFEATKIAITIGQRFHEEFGINGLDFKSSPLSSCPA
jgi:hypothetical protein